MRRSQSIRRVTCSFVGAVPTRRLQRTSGVKFVVVEGLTVRCCVYGSFQPFLEALRGYEVLDLLSSPVDELLIGDECLNAASQWLA